MLKEVKSGLKVEFEQSDSWTARYTLYKSLKLKITPGNPLNKLKNNNANLSNSLGHQTKMGTF